METVKVYRPTAYGLWLINISRGKVEHLFIICKSFSYEMLHVYYI